MSVEQQKAILTIDDDDMVRLGIVEYLEDAGYQVFEAENGLIGVELFEHHNIDLILVDLRMPVMNGLEVLAHVSEISPETPLIVISGIGTIQDAMEAVRQGAWDYLLKPIEDPLILDHAIKNVLEKARLKQEILEYQQSLEKKVEKRTLELLAKKMQLLESEKQLRQAQKMEALGTLAGGIAHDFNSILGVIIGCTELSLLKTSQEHPGVKYLHQSLEAAKRATNLVQQILTFSRQKELPSQPLRMDLVVRETIKLLRAIVPSTVVIEQQLNSDAGMVLADPTHIQQIVMNLAMNAVHAIEENCGKLHIKLESVEILESMPAIPNDLSAGSYLELSVCDTGGGISPENLDRIFDPYFTTKNQEEGTGLGLAVVDGIVKKYGGNISVRSTLGEGACFDVFLPRISNGDNVGEVEALANKLPKGTECILVVDDDHDFGLIIGEMLGSLGYQVEVVTSAQEALQLFEENPNRFNLLFSDMTMPHMTGDELAKAVLNIHKDFPVILCTGYSDCVDWGQANEFGVADTIFKPVQLKSIAIKVRQALDKKISQQQ